jgi:exodeoxyribonuclease-1
VHAQLAQPGTCGAGYNTLRFDDEVTRYSLYRNFSTPMPVNGRAATAAGT